MQKPLHAPSGDNNDDEIIAPAEFGDVKVVRRIFGLRERLTYDLMHDGVISSAMIRVRGSRRGKRLFNLQTIRDFLRSREAVGVDLSPSPADYKKQRNARGGMKKKKRPRGKPNRGRPRRYCNGERNATRAKRKP